ncbi:MAG: hypothetical protein K1X83_12125 [Oligoflexia bacterium]|nr:hypothetical protein [Oligoflexia bacterium]
MDFAGVLMMLIGLFGVAFGVIATGWFMPETPWGQLCIALTPYAIAVRILRKAEVKRSGFPSVGAPEVPIAEPEAPSRRPEAVQEIERATVTDFLEIDGRTERVKGCALLLQLQFFGGDKSNKVHVSPSGETLQEYRALCLAGDQLLVEHPEAEGGDLKFFLYERTEMPQGFSEYMGGTSESPGPVRRFAASGQRADVDVEALGKTWRLKDIIWIDAAQVSGEFFVRPSRNGQIPRVAMALARCENDWLLFADLRSGDGSDTLWVGQQFDPKVTITV